MHIVILFYIFIFILLELLWYLHKFDFFSYFVQPQTSVQLLRFVFVLYRKSKRCGSHLFLASFTVILLNVI